MLVCAFVLRIWHARPRVQRAPGLPCALCFRRGQGLQELGRNRAARMWSFVRNPVAAHVSGRRTSAALRGMGSRGCLKTESECTLRAKTEQGGKPCSKKRAGRKALLQKLCRPFYPKIDLILIDGTTLLMRARAPPETWTTRLGPFGQPELIVVDYLFGLVTISGNDCSKFEQVPK
jgi:hypothetical protein